MQEFSQLPFKRKWDYSRHSLYYLGQISSMINSIAILPLLPNYHETLLKVSLQKGARATTAIEGNTLSEDEIQKVQAGESLPPSKEYQEIEVKNILEAFNKIREDIIIGRKNDLIEPSLIKEFNLWVGKDLGVHFNGNPGKFRNTNVVVGTYKPPDHTFVPELIDKLCEFLKTEFHYRKGQKFGQAVVQSIITHVYIELIHPFGDGNGRTGRLLEYYLLMRAGNPDIASHILSNHYNDTRTEYYRQLDVANKNGGDLTSFIEYALQGFRDGLRKTINIIQYNLLTISWQKLVYDKFADVKYRGVDVFKRKRKVMLNLPIVSDLSMDDIFFHNKEVAKEYGGKSTMTLRREIEEFINLGLLVQKDNKYRANTDLLMQQTPLQKISETIVDGF